jgi:hypothetical protein
MRQIASLVATDWSAEYTHTITGRGAVKPRPVVYRTSFFPSPAGAERGVEAAW